MILAIGIGAQVVTLLALAVMAFRWENDRIDLEYERRMRRTYEKAYLNANRIADEANAAHEDTIAKYRAAIENFKEHTDRLDNLFEG